tara:strand:+ start:753 stop:1109 length:357 start_codon:yes stop_codon:yes gene_type:complete
MKKLKDRLLKLVLSTVNKFKDFLPKAVEWVIPTIDKLKHYYLWSLSFFVMIYLFYFIEILTGLYISDWYAYAITVISALWKELYNDKYLKKGNAELKDFLAGIAIATFYMIKIKLLII